MTEKQYVAMVANMRAQSVYQQQMIGHLVALVHGLKDTVLQIAVRSGIETEDLDAQFADAARKMNHTLAEIPFPEFQWPDAADEPSPPSQRPPEP